MGITVAALEAADRPFVERMLLASGPVFSRHEVEVALELADEALRGEYTAFAAKLDGETAGYCLAGPTPLTVSTWHLYWLCVHPAARRRGVASALQGTLEKAVRNAGGERIVLETSSRADYESARHYYCSAGYSQVGKIEDYYKPGDACILFCKIL